MFLARVQGHIVATAKDPGINGMKLLMVEPLKVRYDDPQAAANTGGASGGGGAFEPTGRAIVALDTIGAGEGQLVLIVQGSSARMAEGCGKCPTDAVVVGIVEQAHVMGRSITELTRNTEADSTP
ncbi:MAG: ethanolamine utilization protein EutN [Planctomycetes bacterium]|jgi:ethanolamine utilization protein EutN|nr:ethanolamine utilization protein EutN [Planctomycetota bacterium]